MKREKGGWQRGFFLLGERKNQPYIALFISFFGFVICSWVFVIVMSPN